MYASLLSIIFFFLSYSSRQHIFVFDYFDMLSIFYCDEFQFSALMFRAVVSNYIYVSRRILQMNKLNCRPNNEQHTHTNTVLIHKSHKTNVKVSVNYTYRGSSQSIQHTTFAIRPKSINHYLSYCTGNQFIFGQFCVERVINNINTFNHLR